MGANFSLPLGKRPHGNAKPVQKPVMRHATPRRAQASEREGSIQKSICDYIAAVAPAVILYAVPNASRRTAGGRAANAVPGLRKGVFDLALVLPPGAGLAGRLGGRAAFIEVKTRNGALTEDQREFRSLLTANCVPHCVARSIEDVRAFFAEHGVPTREVLL